MGKKRKVQLKLGSGTTNKEGGAGMEPNSQLEFLFQSAFESGS